MATKKDVDDLRALCETARSVPLDELVSRSSWGPIKFETAKPSLKAAFYLFDALSTLPVDILPDGELSQLVTAARAVANRLSEINKFSIETVDNPKGHAENLSSALKTEAEQFLRFSTPILPFLAYYRGNIQAQLAQLEASIAKASKLYDDGKATIEGKTKQIDDALNAARMAAAKAGAAVFTQDFLNEAASVEMSAKNWLWVAGTCGAGAIAVALVAFFGFPPSPNASITYVIQHTVTKLVVIGGLITAAVWCGSMYRALRHQAAINRHRGNSLKTFQAFVEAAGDQPDIRNAVLLETTRSIFAVAPTGFLNATETNVDGGPKIADAIKAFGKGG